jgi:hypothetical protein
VQCMLPMTDDRRQSSCRNGPLAYDGCLVVLTCALSTAGAVPVSNNRLNHCQTSNAVPGVQLAAAYLVIRPITL